MFRFFKKIALLALFLVFVSTNNAYAADPDINDDGVVNIFDVSLMSSCLIRSSSRPINPKCDNIDQNDDGYITSSDLSIVISHFGEKGFLFSEPVDKNKVIYDPNVGRYPVNEILISFPQDENNHRSIAEEIALNVGGVIAGFIPETNLYKIRVQTNTASELQELIDSLSSDPRLDGVSHNIYSTNFVANDVTRNSDTNKTNAFYDIHAIEAWDIIAQGTGVVNNLPKIGVIDTGVDTNHPEFINVNFGNTPASARVDLNTPDTGTPENPNCDSNIPHGTMVTGIIGASNSPTVYTNKDLEINGILAGATSRIGISKIPYDLEVRNHEGDIHGFLKSISNLSNNNVNVINISSGFIDKNYLSNPYLPCVGATVDEYTVAYDEFDQIIRSHPNITFVVAAGNSSIDVSSTTPANIDLPNVITVASTDYYSTNFGDLIDISAPGKDIYAPINFTAPLDENDYAFASGTSFSAPLVTGVIGLMKSIDPSLSPSDLKEILRETGDDTDALIGGKRLNAARAVACTLKRKEYDVPLDLLDDENLKNDIITDLSKPICGFGKKKIFISFSNPVITVTDETVGNRNLWSDQLINEGIRLYNIQSQKIDSTGEYIGEKWQFPLYIPPREPRDYSQPMIISGVGKRIMSISFDIYTYPFDNYFVYIVASREGVFNDPPEHPDWTNNRFGTLSNFVSMLTPTINYGLPTRVTMSDFQGFTNVIIGMSQGLNIFYIDNVELELADAL